MATSPNEDGGRWGLWWGQYLGWHHSGSGNSPGYPSPSSGAGAVCLSPPPEGRGSPPGSGGWLLLWGIGTWTWEYRVCMGSVSVQPPLLFVFTLGAWVCVFMCTLEGGNM
ncbi:hypothetical protein CHARACLAT_010819 [Characodon lateralis]|uniref:Uncharacterized protein n=1 Tax=Characodon lateralis TaxID=208331 RepID=A0ABU7E8P6_9TELE|nr:hypothetical protein [Characodon lateralis]